MHPRPFHRATLSRQHMRLAGAMAFRRGALAFRLRGLPRGEDVAAASLDAFTHDARAALRAEAPPARQ